MIWTFKERLRALRSGMLFTRVPKRIIIEAVAYTTLWLNAFPSKEGVSTTYSPRNIVLGSALNQRLHCRMPFGAYAKVHNAPEPLNRTDVPRTTPAICLGPTGNKRGSYKFMSLQTGQVILRYQFTKHPATPASSRASTSSWTRTNNVTG